MEKIKNSIKVRISKPFFRRIGNIKRRFQKFTTIEMDKFSDEWFNSEMTKVNRRGLLCEAHRQIYKSVLRLPDGKEKEIIKLELKKAYIMGRKMDDKLREYKVFMHE